MSQPKKPCPGHEVTKTTHAVPDRLPKGLVGSCCTANIKIAGEEFNCLLDTGSQVTTIPVSFYNQHFTDQPVKPLCELMQVEGAAGQTVPYLGYVEMVVTFPREFLRADFNVSTLALVVPDAGAHQSPVLIGMNTLEPLYDQYIQSEFANFQPTAHGYKAVLKLLQIGYNQQQVGNDGVVRLASKTPVLPSLPVTPPSSMASSTLACCHLVSGRLWSIQPHHCQVGCVLRTL